MYNLENFEKYYLTRHSKSNTYYKKFTQKYLENPKVINRD